MTTDRNCTILVIEDDDAVRRSLVAFLEDRGFALQEARDGRAGLDLFRKDHPDLVVLDLRMPEIDGLEVLATIVRDSPDTPVIVVSGASMIGSVVEALHLGAWDYVTKPIEDLAVIADAIEKALKRTGVIRGEREYRQRLEQEVQARTAQIKAVNETLRRENEERRRAEELLRKQHDLAAALAATSSLEEGLRLCVDAAMEVSRMDCGGVYLVDDATGIMQLRYHRGVSPAFAKAVSRYDFESIYAEQLSGQKTHYIHARELPPPLGEAERREGLRALAALPFGHQGRMVGQLSLASHHVDEIPEYCRPTLEAIVSQMGSVVFRLTAEAELRESEARFRTLFESAPIALGVGTPAGKVLASNDIGLQLLGYTGAEIDGADLTDIYADPQDRPRLLRQLREQGIVRDRVVLMKRRDGTTFHASVTLVPFTFEGQECHLSAFEDITERKQAEETSKAHVLFLENLELIDRTIRGHADLDQVMNDVLETTLSIFACDRAWLVFPCDPETDCWRVPIQRARPGCPGAEVSTSEYPATPDYAEYCRKLLASDGPVALDKTGEIAEWDPNNVFEVQSILAIAIRPKVGKPWAIGLHQCTHPRRWSPEERRLFKEIARRIEDALSSLLFLRDLSESSARFRTVVDQAGDGLFLLTPDGKIVDVNQRACDSLGYSRQELLSMTIPDVDVEAESGQHRERFWKAAAPGTTVTFEGRHRRRDGTEFPVEVRLGPLELGGRRLLLALARDVTERRKAERDRDRLFKISVDMMCIAGFDGHFKQINPAWTTTLGWTPEELCSKPWLDYVHPEDREATIDAGAQLSAGNPVYAFENRYRCKDGTYRWISWNSLPVLEEQETFAVARDITERRQAEEARKAHIHFLESLERVNGELRRQADLEEVMTDALGTVLSIFDADRAWLAFPCDPSAPSWRIQLERTRPEYPGASASQADHPMTSDVAELWQRLLASEEPDAQDRIARTMQWDSDDVYRVQSILAIALWPKVGKPWVFGLHQCSHSRVWSADDRRLLKEIGRRIEDSLSNLLVLRDLSESSARLRAVVNQAGDGLFLLAFDGTILDVNQHAADSLGYTREELLSMTVAEIDVEAESQRHRERYWETLTPGASMTFEGVQQRKDGSRFPVEVRVGLMEHAGESCVLGLARDITERKRAEEIRRASEQSYREIFNATNELVFVHDAQTGAIKDVNQAVVNQMGYSHDELLSLTVGELSSGEPPFTQAEANRLITQAMEQGGITGEWMSRKKCGDLFWTEINLKPAVIAGEDCVLCVARDISERKRVEEALDKERQQLISMFDGIEEAIYVTDPNTYEMLYMNSKARELWGEGIGGKCHQVLQGQDSPCSFCTNDRIFGKNEGKPYIWEFQNQVTQSWFRCIDKAVRWPDGRMVRLEMAIDLTDRKRAEEALCRSEERFRQIAENAQEWIWEVDTNGLYTYSSSVVEAILGFRPQEVVGKMHFFDLIHPDDRVEITERAFDVFARKEPIHALPNRCLHKSGKEVWLSTTALPILDDNGNLLGYRGADTDITEYRRAEAERQAHVQFLESLEHIDEALRGGTDLRQSLSDAIAVVFSVLECDRAWLLYPADPEAPTFRIPVEHCRPEFPGALALDVEVPIGPGSVENIVDALACDGPVAHVNGTAYPVPAITAARFGVQAQMLMAIHPTAGKPWMIGVHQCSYARPWTPAEKRLFQEMGRRVGDALNALLLMREVRQSEERFRSLVESTSDWIWEMDNQCRYTYCSPKVRDLLGYRSEEIIGKTLFELMSADQAERLRPMVHDLLQSGAPIYELETIVPDRDGREVVLETNGVAVVDANGSAIGYRGVNRDITERKRAQEALTRLNDELEEKVRERTRELEEAQEQLLRKEKLAVLGQLAGGVSHEIRNPLGVIKNAIYFLRMTQKNLNDKGQKHLGLIEQEVNTANRIITELLDYAREPRTQPTDIALTDCIERALLVTAPPTEVRVQRQLAEAPATVWATGGQIEQILVNLMRNAVQAMPEGGQLTIRGHTRGSQAVIEVADTGVGISSEDLAKVFEPLFTNKAKGIGLGLAISRQYAEANKGELTVAESEPGRGTVFCLVLPLCQPN